MKHGLVIWISAAVLLSAREALACPMCFSANNNPLVQANGWGIATLLILTVVMLAAFATFFLTLWRRAKNAVVSEHDVPDIAAAHAPAGPGRC